MKQDKKRTKTRNAYKPKSTLTRYLEEKLQLSQLERKNKVAGEPLSESDQKRKELNQRMRVHILNRHVFESMANVVYFFEFVGLNSLLDEFEDDIRELLRGKKYVKKLDGTYELDSDVFSRLIHSMVDWDVEKDAYNFRVFLLSEMQDCVRGQFGRLSRRLFGDLIRNDIVDADFERAFAWTYALAQRKETDRGVKPERHHRPVLF
jgi:hypothetical protein